MLSVALLVEMLTKWVVMFTKRLIDYVYSVKCFFFF